MMTDTNEPLDLGAWSADVPTEPGWYWLLDKTFEGVPVPLQLVFVKRQEAFFAAEDYHVLLSKIRGVWQRVTPPALPDGDGR